MDLFVAAFEFYYEQMNGTLNKRALSKPNFAALIDKFVKPRVMAKRGITIPELVRRAEHFKFFINYIYYLFKMTLQIIFIKNGDGISNETSRKATAIINYLKEHINNGLQEMLHHKSFFIKIQMRDKGIKQCGLEVNLAINQDDIVKI